MTGVPDRKQDILKAATELILSEGGASLTIRKVANAVNISTGLVLYHFATKENLIEEAWRNALVMLGARINVPESVGGMEWMENFLRARFLEAEKNTLISGLQWMEYWNHIARTPELHAEHSKTYKDWQSIEVRRLERGIAEKQLADDLDPTLVADMFHTLICGLLVKTAIDPGVITSERAFAISRFFLSLISPQGEGHQPEGQ